MYMNINLPGLTRIGHNWHLLPLNENGNQGKKGNSKINSRGQKGSKKKTFFDYSICKIKLSDVDLPWSAFSYLFCSSAGVLYETVCGS